MKGERSNVNKILTVKLNQLTTHDYRLNLHFELWPSYTTASLKKSLKNFYTRKPNRGLRFIQIVENDWRIHSVQLELTRESQMDILDTLRIKQLYVPVTKDVWVIKNQVIYPAVKFMGFDGYGSFVNVYSDFELSPDFPKGYFDNTYLRYGDSSNKRTRAYWDSTRPVPLQAKEMADYKKRIASNKCAKAPATWILSIKNATSPTC